MAKAKILPEGWNQLVADLGRGMLNLGYFVEAEAKREAPVRGGYRSFQPDGPVGGTLRRSIHTAAWVMGVPVPGSRSSDENGVGIPAYEVPGDGAVVYVGTNSGYGRYVEEGTVRMAARPFLAPAHMAGEGRAAELIATGAKRR